MYFPTRRRDTGGVDQGNLHGWHPDPFGRHEARYFSAGRPTKLVRDGDAESYDQLPATDPAACLDPDAGTAAVGA